MGDREQLLTSLCQQLQRTKEDLAGVEQQLSFSALSAYHRRTLTVRQQALQGRSSRLAELVDQAGRLTEHTQ